MTRTILWVIFFAAVIDVSINQIFSIPYRFERGVQLANYFEYGRSVESKITRMVADNDDTAQVAAKLGWFKAKEESAAGLDQPGLARNLYVYGMSFSSHIAVILPKIDASLRVQYFDGPGAPLNHSIGNYEFTRPHQSGDIVVLGILASSLPGLNTMTHMTMNFESPSPHFYPRYRFDDEDRIVSDEIDIHSLPELRSALRQADSWNEVKRSLAQHDSFYDPVIFESSILDQSVYLRLVKRAWGQRSLAANLKRFHDAGGFKNEERMIDLAQGLVGRFADGVRADGAIPYVILFNDRGYEDHLHQVLEPVLDRKNIAYYSTHVRYPATNLANFIADGHFTREIDAQIAAGVYQDLQRLLN